VNRRVEPPTLFLQTELPVPFDTLPLHDAVLTSISVGWDAARCELRFRLVDRPSHVLVFEGFTNIELPRRESWGPSSSVNSARQPAYGVFEIELQSGDVIRIEAPRWTFLPEDV